MKGVIAVLLGASPFVLHLAIVRSSRVLMIVFLAIVLAGLLAAAAQGRLPMWVAGVAALALAAFATLDAVTAVRVAWIWPILGYLAIAWIFGHTLRPGRMPLIERIARRIDQGDAIPSELVRYTRILTWAWTVVPLAIALVSVLLAQFATREVWSLFTNILGYVALAVLFLAEYPYRRWRYPHTPHTNPITVALRLARSAPEYFGRHSGRAE